MFTLVQESSLTLHTFMGKREGEYRLYRLDDEIAFQPINLITYGTLMAGERNHELIKDRVRLVGKLDLQGFNVANLGSYPGIAPNKKSRVLLKTELYRINPTVHPMIAGADVDQYEGVMYRDGGLYKPYYLEFEIGQEIYKNKIYIYCRELMGFNGPIFDWKVEKDISK